MRVLHLLSLQCEGNKINTGKTKQALTTMKLIKGRRKTNKLFVTDRSVNEEDAECSETEKRAKYFVTFLQGYPLKTLKLSFRTKVFHFIKKTYMF